MYRFALASAFVLALGLAACVSAEDRAAADAARQACQTQYPDNPSQMDACVAQMEASIQQARQQAGAPPPPPQRPASGSGSSSRRH